MGEELGEELGTIGKRYPEKIDDDAFRRICEHPGNLVYLGRSTPAPEGHDVMEGSIVSLGVDDAELKRSLHQTFDETGSERRLAATGWTCDEEVMSVRREIHRDSILAGAEHYVVSRSAGTSPSQISRHEFVHQLDDAGACWRPRRKRDLVLESGHGVVDSDRTLADIEERVVVRRVADTDNFVQGEPEPVERRLEAGSLVDARWEDHDGVTIENELELERELADGIDDHVLMGMICRHDHVAHRERRDTPLLEPLGELIGQG